MKNWKKIQLVFFGLCLIIGVLVWQWMHFQFHRTAENNLHLHLPQNTQWYVRVNQAQLMEELVDELMAQEDLSDLETQIQEMLDQQKTREAHPLFKHIDFQNELLLFRNKNGQFGMLFHSHPSETNEWKKPTSFIEFAATKNDFGYIMFQSKLPLAFAKKGNLPELDTEHQLFPSPTNHSIVLAGNGIQGNFTLDQESIIWKGKIKLKAPHFSQLQPKGFHFSTNLLPKELSDSLQVALSSLGIKTPTLSGFSMNYEGLRFFKNASIPAFPEVELLMHFEGKVIADTILNALAHQLGCPINPYNHSFSVEDENYFVQQLDPYTIYLGRQAQPALIQKNMVAFKGDLKALTKIKAGGFYAAILQMQPIFKALKNLELSCEKLELNIDSNGDAQFVFQVKKGAHVRMAIFSFLLNAQLIQ